MSSQAVFVLALLPEVVVLVGTCALMIVDLRVKGERRTVSFVLAQVVLLAAAAATVFVQWASGATRVYLFHDLFVSDPMSNVLKFAAYVAVAAALVYSRQYLLDRGLLRGEFMTLLLFALLGMMVMMSAASFLTVYLGLELLSLCLYAMVALNRDSASSVEAAMKYFVLGALASGLLLYGMSMIYGATGTLTLAGVAKHAAGLAGQASDRTFLVFGLVFVVAGIAFKLGLVPFHMWIPDVYHGAPTAVTLVIGTAPKLAAIAQTNLKRMLAYSTIAHMGFMLLGLLSGVVGTSPTDVNTLNRYDAHSAAMFYTIVYVLMSLGAFGMLVFLSRAGFECETLDDMRGLNRTSPWFAFVMLVLMFSLAGVPPTAGFYAKLSVLSAAVNAGQIWLAVVAVLLSLVGAFYYLRIVKLMYFDEPREAGPVPGHPEMRVLLSANGLALLVIGILPQPLMSLAYAAIRAL